MRRPSKRNTIGKLKSTQLAMAGVRPALFWTGILLVCALLASGTPVKAAEAAPKSGWVREAGENYYYSHGEAVTGWKKISGKWYFFSRKTHAMAKNQIAGDNKKGYYYVDAGGVRVNDKAMNQAVKCIRRHAKREKTPLAKLKACYRYFVDECSYRSYPNVESRSRLPSFAMDMFRNRAGDCYRGTAALTYCAKALGFQTPGRHGRRLPGRARPRVE